MMQKMSSIATMLALISFSLFASSFTVAGELVSDLSESESAATRMYEVEWVPPLGDVPSDIYLAPSCSLVSRDGAAPVWVDDTDGFCANAGQRAAGGLASFTYSWLVDRNAFTPAIAEYDSFNCELWPNTCTITDVRPCRGIECFGPQPRSSNPCIDSGNCLSACFNIWAQYPNLTLRNAYITWGKGRCTCVWETSDGQTVQSHINCRYITGGRD